MKLSEKLVVAPVFSNLRIMPKVGEETRFGIDVGLGHAFAIGRGDLSGMSATLSADSDDHYGRLAWRLAADVCLRLRRRVAPTPGHHPGRRLAA